MALRLSSMQIFESFYQRTGKLKRNLSLGSLCLGSVCIGLTLDWPESSLSYLILLYCSGNCLNTALDDVSTGQMIMNCGSSVGALLPCCFADTYGRKFSFALASTSNFVFWVILFAFEGDKELTLVSAIAGLAAGIFVSTSALYVSEISLPRTRGSIWALGAAGMYAGGLFGSCLTFVTFLRTIALIMICLATFFLASLRWWMIESPYFFFLQGKTLHAKVALKKLRGARTVLEIDPEYKTIELFFHISQDVSAMKGSRNSFFSVTSRKRRNPALVLIFLCITQMVGAYGINDNAKMLLDRELPAYRRMILSSSNFVSLLTWFFVIDRINRRSVLLVISVFGSSLTCLILALITLVGSRVDNYYGCYSTLLPASLLVLYYMVSTLGLTPISCLFCQAKYFHLVTERLPFASAYLSSICHR
ncbi:uncharacterized protein [Venturia canescens]|uniref:uncharacterized protein n=1 Tax=Venturia canescens TaxID=32260 RepID=UPI001C9BE7B8|nr:uncharacterized protein LOC122412550 [Venturia canescens]